MAKKRRLKLSTSFLSKVHPKTWAKKRIDQVTVVTKRRPMLSFLAALGLLFLVILLNSMLTPRPKEITETSPIKEVGVYKIGSAPRVSFSAKVDKEGVIQIVALTPGVVSTIHVTEGQTVWRGNTLVSLSSNYQGGNALSVQRQLAYSQYKNVKDTFDTQKELIEKQKELANKVDQNSDDMRTITDKSISETRDLISFNASTITVLEANLVNAEGTGDPAQIGVARQMLFQARSANAQLSQAQRNSEFQAAGDKSPAHLSDLQKDIALKQLDLQQKALTLSKETSRLQLVLAQIAESMMFPSAPFEAVVEKVHVTLGQSVNPGTPLVTIAGTNRNATALAAVPYDIAKKISQFEESTLHIGGKTYSLLPSYVSSEATDGLLNSVMYSLSDEIYDKVSDGQYIKIEIPIGYADTLGSIPYIPIDIVFQTQDGAFVYVVENNKVKSRRVTLGDVVGKNVAVDEGLKTNDQVILDRNVIEGEGVRIAN